MSNDAEYILRATQTELYGLEDEVIYLREKIKKYQEALNDERKIADKLAELLYSLEQENNFQVARNDALIAYEQARR
jgi:hypothetical protein